MHEPEKLDVQLAQQKQLPPCGRQKTSWHGTILHSGALSCVLIRSILWLVSNSVGCICHAGCNREVTECRCPNHWAMWRICFGRKFGLQRCLCEQHSNTFPHTPLHHNTPHDISTHRSRFQRGIPFQDLPTCQEDSRKGHVTCQETVLEVRSRDETSFSSQLSRKVPRPMHSINFRDISDHFSA
jgi:hypothetical protein